MNRATRLSRRRLALGLGWAGALAACAGPAPKGAPATVLRYTDHEPLGNMRTRFLHEVLFPAIARESGGRVAIERHWGGELSGSYDNLKTVAEGRVADMGVVVPEYHARALPLQQLFKSFPVGPSGARQVALLRRAYGEIPAFDAELARAGVARLFLATGHPVAFFSRAPLASLADMRGQRWRTASFWHSDFLRAAGAEPVTMPWGPQVFEALRTGALDGLMVNVDSGLDLAVPQVAPNVLLARELWLGHVYVIAMNAGVWGGLDAAARGAIARACEQAYARLGDVMDASHAAMLQTLRAGAGSVPPARVRELSAREVAAFREASRFGAAQDAWVATAAAQSDVASPADTLGQLRRLMAEAAR